MTLNSLLPFIGFALVAALLFILIGMPLLTFLRNLWSKRAR